MTQEIYIASVEKSNRKASSQTKEDILSITHMIGVMQWDNNRQKQNVIEI